MIRILVGCQNDECASEVSYHLNMVRMFERQPICQDCYQDGEYDTTTSWDELPGISVEDLSP